MAHIHKEVTVHANPDGVWAAIRDVGAVHQRLARGFVVDTRLDGDSRIVTFKSGTMVRERIIDVDDRARRLDYSIVGGRATHHRASMQMIAEGDGGSRVVWITDVLPDSLADTFDTAMAQGCDVMKTTLEAFASGVSDIRARKGGVMTQEVTIDAKNTDVRVEVTVAAPVEQAFHVFTERMHDWWRRSDRLGRTERTAVVLEPRPGGRWYERTADGGECDWGRVLLWQPPHRLALSWQIGVGFAPQDDPERASRVDVSFTEEGPDRTTVALTHSAFERHGEGWRSMRDAVANQGGWPGKLAAFSEVAPPDRATSH